MPSKDKEDKPINIIINGTPTKFDGDSITYMELVELAFPNHIDTVYTVTYAGPKIPDGTLTEGQSLEIRNGVKFVVKKTNRS